VVIARQILARYRRLDQEARRGYFRFLADAFQPDESELVAAARAYAETPGEAALARLREAAESPRREFFHRLNLAPGATAEIVALRKDLLRSPKLDPSLMALDADLMDQLNAWFNRGFLVLRRIDWQTPAVILEKIIAYEAVHEIQGWDDLRRRLDPNDRRCFAFFHPSLVDEPLIFVEVALTGEAPEAIQPLLQERHKVSVVPQPTTAVFYSISNCQEGLKGISFGNFLIKQVVEELAKELPSLKTFVTLSPVPHFARWLDRVRADDAAGVVTDADREALQVLEDPGWHENAGEEVAVKGALLALAAHYFLMAKSADGRPVDPVARFHLGNGARLDRLNWLGDVSEKGLREAHGLMVNYRYDLKDIEKNHEAYANDGAVAASRAVRALLRPAPKIKAAAEVSQQKPLPLPSAADAARKPEWGE
jgi:malonyl-CoA decarboxylase